MLLFSCLWHSPKEFPYAFGSFCNLEWVAFHKYAASTPDCVSISMCLYLPIFVRGLMDLISSEVFLCLFLCSGFHYQMGSAHPRTTSSKSDSISSDTMVQQEMNDSNGRNFIWTCINNMMDSWHVFFSVFFFLTQCQSTLFLLQLRKLRGKSLNNLCWDLMN